MDAMNGGAQGMPHALTAGADGPRTTLFCIPHAGGGVSAFRNWAASLAPHVDVKVVQLPGRESRFREPPLHELGDVLGDLQRSVAPAAGGPFAFFGHSMGGLLAYELCHMLRRDTGREPVHLFVSACRAPHIAPIDQPCSALPQPEFIAEVMRRYGGIPAAILADDGFMSAIVPAMRADFGILERYRPPERPPLGCHISVFGGRDDKATPRPSLEAWQRYTTNTFSLEMLDGDHFFLQAKRSDLIAAILAATSMTSRISA
jgi:medium-chain acyl-[acyl-carrier-protein] hydrolase